MVDMSVRCFNEGCDARWLGIPKKLNPYIDDFYGPGLHWKRGWESMDREWAEEVPPGRPYEKLRPIIDDSIKLAILIEELYGHRYSLTDIEIMMYDREDVD